MEKKTQTKKFNSKKLIVLIAVAVLLVSTALAWFVYTATPIGNTFGLSNFQTELDCYFSVGNSRVEVDNYIDSDTNLINLSLDPTDNNYLCNFHVDVLYKGAGHGYLRVKVVTEAKDSMGYVTVMDPKVPYIVSDEYEGSSGNNQEAWFDNRNLDYCYYYATALSGEDDQFTTLSVIDGAQTTDIDSEFDLDYLYNNGYTLSVAVASDMVQINRYPQFWGMNKLPWKI